MYSASSNGRRRFLTCSAVALISPNFAAVAQQQAVSFEDILAVFRSQPALVDGMRRKSDDPEEVALERAPLRSRKSSTSVSPEASDLIVACEVSSESVYEKRYRVPIWPKGASGVTIGIGYDVGYVTPDYLQLDWNGYLTPDQLAVLAEACGVTGPSASALLPKLKSNINVPWSSAYKQFRSEVLPRYIGITEGSLPHTNSLHPHCLGALVSLVYNRGAPFDNPADRFREMRNIKKLMAAKALNKIPAELLSMRRLWLDDPDMKGVVFRREAEAKLFELGLKASKPF